MPSPGLVCWMNGDRVGTWNQSRGQDQFTYHPEWLTAPHRRPISLSLPLRGQPHRGPVVTAYFENLLPELPEVRMRLAERLGLDSPDPRSLLTELGRDCAGALQFLPVGSRPGNAGIKARAFRKEYLEKLMKIVPRAPILRTLRNDFRVCLPGEQEKTALLQYQGEWQLPLDYTPTSHIFKLASPDKPPHALENEWLCHLVLKAYQVPVANSQLLRLGQQTVLVVERFDRRWSSDGSRLLRIPTEDLCQALGKPAHHRYERNGGPNFKNIMDLLLGSSQAQQDRANFFRAQLVFWMLGALDGHCKNFSIFLEPQGRFRLAPCYDVMSWHPLRQQSGDLAMSLGFAGETQWDPNFEPAWRACASQCKMKNEAPVIVRELVERTPEVVREVWSQLDPEFPRPLAECILGGLTQAAMKLAISG